MNKYNHKITSCSKTKYGFALSCNKVNIDIAVLEHNVLRVVQYTDLPSNSYNIAYKDNTMPIQGNSRLSTDHFTCPSHRHVVDDGCISIGTASFVVNIDTHNFHITYCNNNEDILFSDRLTQSHNFYGELGDQLCHYTTRKVTDKCYGLGDKTGNINRSGGSWEFCNIDAMGYDANSTDPLYKHVPFYICDTDKGSYGMFYDTHATSWLSLGREKDNYHGLYNKFVTEDKSLCYYVIFGSRMEILRTFAQLVGRTAFMPKWSLNYSGSSMSYTDATDADHQLRQFVLLCRQHDVSCGSFHLSSGYSTVNGKRCVFCWDYDKIPHPDQLAKHFVDNDIQLIANIKPAMLLCHPMYQTMCDRGYFLKNGDGSTAVSQFWDGLGSYIDFTNVDAFQYWVQQVQQQLINNNIFNTWNDNNEYEVWDKQVLCHNFGDNMPAYLMRPAFAVIMLMASTEAQRRANLRPMLSCRSGSIGIVRYAHTWTGDNATCFATLRGNHKMGISQSLSGIYNFGHDVGGFAGNKPDQELLLRWLQHGIFMPRFAMHSWNDDGSTTELWMYPQIWHLVRDLLKTRHMLLPHIYNSLYKSHVYYTPIISPVFLLFEDEACDVESDSYMVGDNVLVCNVMDSGANSVDVYLPYNIGGWYMCNIDTSSQQCKMQAVYLQDGMNHNIEYSLEDKAKFFVKAGSILPINTAPYGFQRTQQNITMVIFAIPQGQFEASYFDDDGVSYEYKSGNCVDLSFTVQCTDDAVKVTCNNLGSMNIDITYQLCDKLLRPLVVGE